MSDFKVVNMKNYPYTSKSGKSTKTYRGYSAIDKQGNFISDNGKEPYVLSSRKTVKEIVDNKWANNMPTVAYVPTEINPYYKKK